MQELFVPMAVLRVKSEDQGGVVIEKLDLPAEVVEGEDVTAHIYVRSDEQDLRVDVDAFWSNDPDPFILAGQVHYLKPGVQSLSITFRPDTNSATDEERTTGLMKRTLSVTMSFRDGRKMRRRTLHTTFTVRLNIERIARRVPPALGKILGLMPKNMR